MSLFDKNLTLLRRHNPALARRVGPIPDVAVVAAKNGSPTLQIQSMYLHSAYDPENEAKKQVADFTIKPGLPTVVYGLGLGYHLTEILKTTGENVFVIEPLMSVFQAFLSAVDLEPFLPRTQFLVAEPTPKILTRYSLDAWNTFVHKPSAQLSKKYFAELERCGDVSDYLASHRLRVLVVNPIYGGSLPTARSCATALENLGHEVEPVKCEDFADSFLALDNVTRSKPNKEILSTQFMNFMSEVIVAKAAEFQPDLILALAQAPLTKETIARLKVMKIPIAFWFVEDFRTLTYWKEIAPAYDYFFTIQKGDFFEELESKKVAGYYLPQACLPSLHKPVCLANDEKETYAADLSFMGAAYYNRIQSFPQLLDFNLKIWGTGWDPESILADHLQGNGERVSSEECVKIFNGAKINLNLHSSTFHESVNPHGDFINPRTFEIAACSAFQLVDARDELQDMFHVGEEMVDFCNMEELKEKIAYYLAHDEERTKIAARGYARVLREHTMEHRMREMLIRVYLDRFEDLKARLDDRKDRVGLLIGQAGADTELGRYLAQFENTRDFTIKTVVEHIEKGEGILTKNELLLLMVDQVVLEGD